MGNTLPGASMRVTQWRRLMAVGALAPLFILSAVLGVVSPSAADDAVAETSGALAVSNDRASTDNTLNESPNETVGEGDGTSPSAGESTIDAEQPEFVENDSNGHLSDAEATESLDSGTPTEGAGVDDQNDLLPEERSADTDEQYEARAVRGGSDFVQCGPGVVYSLQENGKIAKYDGSKTGSVAEMPIDVENFSIWAKTGNTYAYLNGLGVTTDNKMYANIVGSSKPITGAGGGIPGYGDAVAILHYDGEHWSLRSFPFKFDNVSNVTQNELIFGAVNPADGKYYYGGYKKNKSTQRVTWHIQIFSYSHGDQEPAKVGTIAVNTEDNWNGDMAFDSAGNLYLVTGPVNQPKYKIYTINKSELTPPFPDSGKELKFTSSSEIELDSTPFTSGFGGMAFDSSGVMYLGSADTIVKANPTTGELLGDGTNTYGDADSSSDLASCGFPPTITLLKDLPEGRIHTSDQFDLTLYQPTDGTEVYGQTTTQGDDSGIQANQVGPLPIYVPGTYKFGEQMSSGSDSVLDAYSKTFKCVQEGENEILASGNLSSSGYAEITVGENSGNIVCTIRNTTEPPAPADATVTISKVEVDHDGEETPGLGWHVSAEISGKGVSTGQQATQETVLNTSGDAASAQWTISFEEQEQRAQVSVSETQKDGFQFLKGSCTINTGTSPTKTVELISASPQSLENIAPDSTVDCIYYNKVVLYDAVLVKKDKDTEEVLAGAKFQLYRAGADGEFVNSEELKVGEVEETQADGFIRWTNLSAGTYFAVETQAPAGYKLNTSPHQIDVPQTPQTPVVVTNEKSVVPDLPLTGGLGSDLFIGLGGLFIGTGVLAYGALWWKRRSI